jgi:hypothetical protein
MFLLIRDFNQRLNSSFCILHGMNILRFLVVFMGLILSLSLGSELPACFLHNLGQFEGGE